MSDPIPIHREHKDWPIAFKDGKLVGLAEAPPPAT